MMSLGISSPILAEDIPNTSSKQSTELKIPVRQPISRKQLAMKFLMAMLGVGASSVIIYVGLSVYNRFIYGSTNTVTKKTEDDELKTPNNMKDALSIFLKKTKNR